MRHIKGPKLAAALLAVADGCCASGSWRCTCFPCTCLTCCCLYGAASGAVLLTALGVIRFLRHPKVVVVGPDSRARADGSEERLLPRELKILGLLAADAGAVVTRDTLMNEAWGLDYYGTTRTVDQTIANLRKKLGPGLDIQSVCGEGYRIA